MRSAGAGWCARRSRPHRASASWTSAADPASTAPSCSRRWGNRGRSWGSTAARPCWPWPPAGATGTTTSSSTRPKRSRSPSRTRASTRRCASRCWSTSPTRPPAWPRCTVPCGPAVASSCGTSTGPPCPCIRRTPLSPSECSMPGTSTSPIDPCLGPSPRGFARWGSTTFECKPTRSRRSTSIRTPTASRSFHHCEVRGRPQGDHRRRGGRVGGGATGAGPTEGVLLREHPVLLYGAEAALARRPAGYRPWAALTARSISSAPNAPSIRAAILPRRSRVNSHGWLRRCQRRSCGRKPFRGSLSR